MWLFCLLTRPAPCRRCCRRPLPLLSPRCRPRPPPAATLDPTPVLHLPLQPGGDETLPVRGGGEAGPDLLQLGPCGCAPPPMPGLRQVAAASLTLAQPPTQRAAFVDGGGSRRGEMVGGTGQTRPCHWGVRRHSYLCPDAGGWWRGGREKHGRCFRRVRRHPSLFPSFAFCRVGFFSTQNRTPSFPRSRAHGNKWGGRKAAPYTHGPKTGVRRTPVPPFGD